VQALVIEPRHGSYRTSSPAFDLQRKSDEAEAALADELVEIERTLIQRINRALPKGQKVKIARGKTAQTRGKFYLVKNGAVVVDNVDLERCARELQVLRYAAAVARRRPQ
jgi:hypothetical protein